MLPQNDKVWPFIAKGTKYQTVLHVAAYRNNLEVVKLFLDMAGEDAGELLAMVDWSNYHETALRC